MNFKSTFKDKKILVTGHTGFKGSWLSLWLSSLGAKVLGVSKYIPTEPSHFEAAKIGDLVKDIRLDILDISELKKIIYKFYTWDTGKDSSLRKIFTMQLKLLIFNLMI